MTARSLRFEWAGQTAFDAATRDAHVEVCDGTVRLARRVVLADEMGNCNGRDVERLQGLTWARKEFWLDAAPVTGARMSVWARCSDDTAVLTADVNGHPVAVRPVPQSSVITAEGQPGAGYWGHGWRTVELPAGWLAQGRNAVILRADDGSQWDILIEEGRFPNRSAKSVDGGRTWDAHHLGFNDCYDGEYLVRLELDRLAPSGEIVSPVFDLAQAAADGLGQTVAPTRLSAGIDAALPQTTTIRLDLRGGPTPAYDPACWCAWQAAASLTPAADWRFWQWRATLSTSGVLETPALRRVWVTAEVNGDEETWGRLLGSDNPPISRPSHPFGTQAPSRRAHLLRERWHLDKVVAGAKDDFERIVRLAHWTRQQWTDGWNPSWKALQCCPPWDAPLILELSRHDLARGMCTHYATVFVQACAALGIPARHVIHTAHCTAEAWSDHWQKWVWLDPGGDLHDETMAVYYVERQGVPQSALELHDAWLSDHTEGLHLVGRNAEEAFRLERRLALLDRFGIVLRNDHMTSLNPGEPEHGAVPYQYDGYLWWQDGKTPPMPFFSLSSGRVDDFYWTPNRTRIHLQRSVDRGALTVRLESSMPHLAGLQVRRGGGDWEDSPVAFVWRLHSGENRLAARSLSAFGVAGSDSSVTVTMP